MKNRFYWLLWLPVAAVLAGSAAQAAELVRFKVEKDREIITVSLPKSAAHKVFTLANPDRLVVDIPAVSGRHNLSLPAAYKGNLIKAARFGQFDPETSRFVFDLKRPVRVTDVRKATHKKETQLIITIAPDKKAGTQKIISHGTKDAGTKDVKTSLPVLTEKKSVKKLKPLIVIDPGHGGVDPGAIGAHGSQEKDLVLLYAKALKNKLSKTGRYRVILTRDDDRFIMLRKRVEIARKAGGVIFLSLHADSAPEQAARGLSVYTVSEHASDMEAEALAARENKADVLAGMDLSEERQDVADILISLAQRETKNRSATLADMLVTRLDDRVKLLPNAHRFAGFAVLKAPDIPSVLVEIGFLSHNKEEKLLKSKSHREKVVSGLTAGIDAYFKLQQQLEGGE
jgi:N-acetylmuramoyl-L-alanine amidase